MAQTLTDTARYEEVIKKSRFLALAAPVQTAPEALEFFAAHHVPEATHNCWAYRIGQEYRSSDDGEPSGTAGRPILAAIDGQGLDQVMVVVIRWYGGIKLGAGGLMRAYGGTAAECLRTAPRRELITYQTARISCPFDALGALHSALDAHQASKLDEDFTDQGSALTIRLPAGQLPALQIRLRDASRDRITVISEESPDAS